MEFDWLDTPLQLKAILPREIEESFEDPFSMRLMPESATSAQATQARYFCLGKSIGNRGIFSVFWTDGKRYRVLAAREMTPEELNFYDRKNAELL
jgi:uncharacterized protein